MTKKLVLSQFKKKGRNGNLRFHRPSFALREVCGRYRVGHADILIALIEPDYIIPCIVSSYQKEKECTTDYVNERLSAYPNDSSTRMVVSPVPDITVDNQRNSLLKRLQRHVEPL